ncbi:NUDIX domain-containing protein [Chryseobacterium sp. BIGb0232]|uniref:NUDIX hydrolase n=1 Tax=Chryseobacterium sp. BIGb0232 TaxID=2940598 RepID=UPI000F464112|nr:NUDIX domain-containing protein [Chryseobacterium sp. BIGb0232]MCS4303291.1 8-oxo-dGTP pyrophosphatase MutT (NUDIX family) [Chryseobacterium sp. BIGb0232]ROS11435.1 ADP-ribose pyrophosphatase YjhB (NUDIX family) [Chryseobacterium nakagawai]
MTNKIIDKLAWIELKDKAILSTKSYGKDKYYIPGGKREAGETDEQALIREISEELSVTMDPKTLNYVGTFEAQAHSHDEGILVKMTCYSGEYSGELQANSEIEEVKWLRYSDKDKISEVDKLIFDYLHTNNLLD